jgi:hypothetical protein
MCLTLPWLRRRRSIRVILSPANCINKHSGHPHRCDPVNYSASASADEEGPTRPDRKQGAGVWLRDWRPEMSLLLVCPSTPPVVLHALTYPYRKCGDVGRAPALVIWLSGTKREPGRRRQDSNALLSVLLGSGGARREGVARELSK